MKYFDDGDQALRNFERRLNALKRARGESTDPDPLLDAEQDAHPGVSGYLPEERAQLREIEARIRDVLDPADEEERALTDFEQAELDALKRQQHGTMRLDQSLDAKQDEVRLAPRGLRARERSSELERSVAAFEVSLRESDRPPSRRLLEASGPLDAPRCSRYAHHEAAHATIALVFGLELKDVDGGECRVWHVAGDVRDAVWALSGEAWERSHGSPAAIGSPSDLAIAKRAMGQRTTVDDWREMRRHAGMLVREWEPGIDAVARVLLREGWLDAAAVRTILVQTYRSEDYRYCEALRPGGRWGTVPWAKRPAGAYAVSIS